MMISHFHYQNNFIHTGNSYFELLEKIIVCYTMCATIMQNVHSSYADLIVEKKEIASMYEPYYVIR